MTSVFFLGSLRILPYQIYGFKMLEGKTGNRENIRMFVVNILSDKTSGKQT